MSKTTALLTLYLEENSTLSRDIISEIVPKQKFDLDIEVDGPDDEERPTLSDTKEMARKMRRIADTLNSEWEQPSKRIVADMANSPKKGSLKSSINSFFQENQLISENEKKIAFVLKCVVDITDKIADSTYLRAIITDANELIDGYSL
ncbi:uncharacterized protein [Antedon mediterranea]|uniref:uncharacterized protein n=1 Tax=Antedon mediterranea TaxID=105859 RepID=UPI003AF740FD